MKKALGTLALVAIFALPLSIATPALAESVGPITFESPAYTVGNINGQQGWSSTGSYDQGVVSNPVISGAQSFRISNAVTSGNFGDQTFAPALSQPAGEVGADNGTFGSTTYQSHFESQFTIEAIPGNVGNILSVSPDRGDGARMSYVRFEDDGTATKVFFDDVQGTSNPANFVETQIGTLSDTQSHTVKFVMDFVNGPSNDVVKIYLDGSLVQTGTSWENYYRYDSESNPTLVDQSRTVRTMLFREGGAAVSANAGKGYLIDDLSLTSSTPAPAPTTVQVHIYKYVDGVQATTANTNSATFPMETTFTSPNLGSVTNVPFTLSPTGWGPTDSAYEASFVGSNAGANYEADEVLGGAVVGASCDATHAFSLVGYSTGDTLAQAQTATKTLTPPAFVNLQSDHYMIVWNKTCVALPPPPSVPTSQNQCKDNGWKTFVDASGTHFKNQGDCVSYVATKGKNKAAG